jgi:hypothetical protein
MLSASKSMRTGAAWLLPPYGLVFAGSYPRRGVHASGSLGARGSRKDEKPGYWSASRLRERPPDRHGDRSGSIVRARRSMPPGLARGKDVMTPDVIYCYDDQDLADAAEMEVNRSADW